jgi:hypothetical protein
MTSCAIALMLACGPLNAAEPPCSSFLCQPAYCIDDLVRCPTQPYCPQPGDIFLATDQAVWAICGHWLAGGAGVHHSGIVFRRSDGQMGLIESGPFNSVQIEVMDPITHMHDHVCAGDKVWIRRRAVPLTEEQSCRLTAFLEEQAGKPFATWRLLGQVTLLRSRGPIRTCFVGKPHGCRDSYFCSELVTESCVAAGLLDPETTRPCATYPRDLFYDHSFNWYINAHLKLFPCWDPPARWLECAVP